jgi:hypothetical protein
MTPIFTSPSGAWGGKVKYGSRCDNEMMCDHNRWVSIE